MSDNNKKVIVSGPLMPSTKDTPIDVRTRVESLEDIVNIQLPYVGMIFFVKSSRASWLSCLARWAIFAI